MDHPDLEFADRKHGLAPGRTATRRPRLHRVADLYDERADELAAVIALEMGKPVREG